MELTPKLIEALEKYYIENLAKTDDDEVGLDLYLSKIADKEIPMPKLPITEQDEMDLELAEELMR